MLLGSAAVQLLICCAICDVLDRVLLHQVCWRRDAAGLFMCCSALTCLKLCCWALQVLCDF